MEQPSITAVAAVVGCMATASQQVQWAAKVALAVPAMARLSPQPASLTQSLLKRARPTRVVVVVALVDLRALSTVKAVQVALV